MLELLGFDPTTPVDRRRVAAARENARGARETISIRDVGGLNVTWHRASRRSASPRNAWDRTVSSATSGSGRPGATGLAESTMSRDDGWRFLVLGRSLERVDMTARLLATQVVDEEHAPAWRRCCAPAARTSRSCGPTAVLVGRSGWPSSCCWTGSSRARSCTRSTEAEECLLELGPGVERAGVGRPGPPGGRAGPDRAGVRRPRRPAGDLPQQLRASAARLPRGGARRHRPLLPARRAGRLGARGGLMTNFAPVGWRLRIKHVTGFRTRAARASYNEARMTPLTLAGQTTL